nr:MAG TPA: Small Terminase [Caudoviricetes sp.]
MRKALRWCRTVGPLSYQPTTSCRRFQRCRRTGGDTGCSVWMICQAGHFLLEENQMARRSDERDAARAEYIARMEKDGEVNLRQLADDLHLKYDTVRRWKAKDGWDPPAARKPGGQPGNKNAVGNSGGGAPVGNLNAEKDGAYSTIFFDRLTPGGKEDRRECTPGQHRTDFP